MANDFTKQEDVIWEESIEKFDDSLILSRNVSKYTADQQTMERANNVLWRVQPYISTSYDGTDATPNFKASTQLSVPATYGYNKHATALLTATELNDAMQEGSLGRAKIQKLASDVNIAVMNVAANQGTLVVARTGAAAGFDDVALCEAAFNEIGVDGADRYLALGTRDYNGMASNLASRTLGNSAKSMAAYEKAYVGQVASFDTYKLDYSNRIAAAAGSAITIDTRASASNYYTPAARSVSSTGESSNVDNRYQTVTVSSTTGIAATDAFTIAGVNSCHHITKGSTGQLKTYRVISVDSSTTMTISPPIISNQGSTEAEAQYQNCIVTTSATAAIVFKNTTAAAVNPFWHRDAIELLPARYSVPTDAGVGVRRAVTPQGLELVMQKFYDIKTMETLFRWDVRFGVCMKQPEMAGIVLFGQV